MVAVLKEPKGTDGNSRLDGPLALFDTPSAQNTLTRITARLAAEVSDGSPPKAARLARALAIIKNNPAEFDAHCQVNIRWIGSQLADEMEKLARTTPLPSVDALYSNLFRFIVEFDLSVQGELSLELRQFVAYADDNRDQFDDSAKVVFDWARVQMPVAIMKLLLNSPPLQNLRDVRVVSERVHAEFDRFEKELVAREQRVDRLRDSLQQYENAFNFVGLFQGFDDLSKAKRQEIQDWRKWLVVFGMLAIAPLCAEILLVYFNRDRLPELRWFFAASAIPVLSLTALFVYFFRIALRGADAARSQLLQVELRKTLCRFIQSYSEYAKNAKEGALAKFENIIFSGLVASDEKLPTTFDGLDQLAALVNAVRGKQSTGGA